MKLVNTLIILLFSFQSIAGPCELMIERILLDSWNSSDIKNNIVILNDMGERHFKIDSFEDLYSLFEYRMTKNQMSFISFDEMLEKHPKKLEKLYRKIQKKDLNLDYEEVIELVHESTRIKIDGIPSRIFNKKQRIHNKIAHEIITEGVKQLLENPRIFKTRFEKYRVLTSRYLRKKTFSIILNMVSLATLKTIVSIPEVKLLSLMDVEDEIFELVEKHGFEAAYPMIHNKMAKIKGVEAVHIDIALKQLRTIYFTFILSMATYTAYDLLANTAYPMLSTVMKMDELMNSELTEEEKEKFITDEYKEKELEKWIKFYPMFCGCDKKTPSEEEIEKQRKLIYGIE